MSLRDSEKVGREEEPTATQAEAGGLGREGGDLGVLEEAEGTATWEDR